MVANRHGGTGMSIAPMSQSETRQPLTRADVMSTTEVAELLDVPRSTVEEWARRGTVPSHKRGRRRFYLRWEIADWLTADG